MAEFSTGRGTLLDAGKGALYFGVLGPPIGALAFTAMLWLMSLYGEPDQSWNELGTGVAAVAAVFVLFSWMFGAVPAVVLGLVAGGFRPRLARWSFCLLIGLLGGLLSIGWGQLMLGVGGEHLGSDPWAFGVPGAVSGLVVARVFGLRAARRARAQAGIGESP
jgi:hypothetical protein